MTPRRLLVLLTIPLVLLLSACLRLEADYEILGADELGMSVDMGVQNSYVEAEGLTGSDLCADNGFVESEGLTLESYTEGGEQGYSGCRQTGTTKLSDLKGSALFKLDDEDVWTFHMDIPDDSVAADEITDFRVSVTFPGKVTSHSGSSTVEGNTVTWTDPKDYVSDGGLVARANHGTDLMWLWGLLGVIALFVLGGVAYRIRNPRNRKPSGTEPHAPEGRIVVRRGGQKSKKQGPHDYGPQVPQDPSSVPKFYHHGTGQ